MMRSFYSADISNFLKESTDTILAKMIINNPFDLVDLQRDAWIDEIGMLKKQLAEFDSGKILLEFTIPRMGKRVDVVILYHGIVFLLEIKSGAREYHAYALDQVLDYALDLKYFHCASENLLIFPVAVPTKAPTFKSLYATYEDGVGHVVKANGDNVGSVLREIADKFNKAAFDYEAWEDSDYKPTPTIIEAAQALYSNHNVAEITRNDAEARNLTETTDKIKEIIAHSRKDDRKSIIFVTGVPGAGKTLVGLNLASEMQNSDEDYHAVFLSGNQPLVTVLQEALARDKVERERQQGNSIRKVDAYREVKSFIQIIHHYRDEYVGNQRVPSEHIAIFDEAQRAWTQNAISSFMARKKNIKNFNYSEPGFLISTMDRLKDWAVIICLVGGGQEINNGEAGLPEWFESLRRSFPNWDVYTSNKLNDSEYLRDQTWEDMTFGINTRQVPSLHLSSSMRSFRSENVSLFVKQLLDNNAESANRTYSLISKQYPIAITRDLNKAKEWVRTISRGSERYGLFASSNAARLKPCGVYYAKDRSSIAPDSWFLNRKDDIRSSFFLEVVASEFETQGLEIDYAIVAWDADYRIEKQKFQCYMMSNRLTPPNWSRIHSPDNSLYLKNAYRVLLTRARQGFVIYIPEGDDRDQTRRPEYYDATYQYLKQIGIDEI